MAGVETQKPVSLVFLEELLRSDTLLAVHIKSAVSASARLCDDAQQVIDLIESGRKEPHFVKSAKRYTRRYLVDALRCVSHLRCIAERQITPPVCSEDKKRLRHAKTDLLLVFDRLLLGKSPATSRSSSASATSSSPPSSTASSSPAISPTAKNPPTLRSVSSSKKPKAATANARKRPSTSTAQTSNADTNAIALCSVDEWSLTSHDKRNRLVIKPGVGGTGPAGRYTRQQQRYAALVGSDSDTDSLESLLLDNDRQRGGGGYLHFLLNDDDDDAASDTDAAASGGAKHNSRFPSSANNTDETDASNPLLAEAQRRQLLHQRDKAQKQQRRQAAAERRERHKHGRGGSPTPSLRACLNQSPQSSVMLRSDVRRAGWWLSAMCLVLVCITVASVVGVYYVEKRELADVADKYTCNVTFTTSRYSVLELSHVLKTDHPEARASIPLWLSVDVVLGLLVVLLIVEAVPPLVAAAVSKASARNAWRTALLATLSGILIALISAGAYEIMADGQTYAWKRIQAKCVFLDIHSLQRVDPATVEQVIRSYKSVAVIILSGFAAAVFVALLILASPLRYGVPYGPFMSLLVASGITINTLRVLFTIKQLCLTLACCVLIAVFGTALTNMELRRLTESYINQLAILSAGSTGINWVPGATENISGVNTSLGLSPMSVSLGFVAAEALHYSTLLVFYIQSTAICTAIAAWIVSLPPYKVAHWRLNAVASEDSTRHALLRRQATPKLAKWAAVCCLAVLIPSFSPLILGGVSRSITHHTLNTFTGENLRLLGFALNNSVLSLPSVEGVLSASAYSPSESTTATVASILSMPHVREALEEGGASLHYMAETENAGLTLASFLAANVSVSDSEIDASVHRVWLNVMRVSACACVALVVLSMLDAWWLVGLLHLRTCWAAENPMAVKPGSAGTPAGGAALFDMMPTMTATAVASVNASLRWQQERQSELQPMTSASTKKNGRTRHTFSNTAVMERGAGKSVQRMVISNSGVSAIPRHSWKPITDVQSDRNNNNINGDSADMAGTLLELKGKLDMLPRLNPQSTRVMHLVLMCFLIPVMIFYAVPSVYFATKLAALPDLWNRSILPPVNVTLGDTPTFSTDGEQLLFSGTAATTALRTPSSQEKFARMYSNAFMAKQDRALEHLELIRYALQDLADSDPALPGSAFLDALRLVALAGDALRKLFIVDHIAMATYLNFRTTRMVEHLTRSDEEDRMWSRAFSNATDAKDVRHSVRSAALDAFLDSLAYIRELWDVLPLVLPIQQPRESEAASSDTSREASKLHWIEALTSVQSSLKSAVATMSTEVDPQADQLWELQTGRVRAASAAASIPTQSVHTEPEPAGMETGGFAASVEDIGTVIGAGNVSLGSEDANVSRRYAKLLNVVSITEARYSMNLLLACFCVLTAACVFSGTFMDVASTRSFFNDLRSTASPVPTDSPQAGNTNVTRDGGMAVGGKTRDDGGVTATTTASTLDPIASKGGVGAGASQQQQQPHASHRRGAEGMTTASASETSVIRKAIIDHQWTQHLRVVVVGDVVLLFTLVIAGIIFWLVNHSAKVVRAQLVALRVSTGALLPFELQAEGSRTVGVSGVSSVVVEQDPAAVAAAAAAAAVKEMTGRLFGAAMDAVHLLESSPSAVIPCALTVRNTFMAAYVETYFSTLRASAATTASMQGALVNATRNVKHWWAPTQAVLDAWHLFVGTNTGIVGGGEATDAFGSDRARGESVVKALIAKYGNFEDLPRSTSSSSALLRALPTDALRGELVAAFAEAAAFMTPYPSAGVTHFTTPVRPESPSSRSRSRSRYAQWLQLAAEASALSLPPPLAGGAAEHSRVDRIAVGVDAGDTMDSRMTSASRVESSLDDPDYVAVAVQWCSIVMMWLVFLSALIFAYGLQIV